MWKVLLAAGCLCNTQRPLQDKSQDICNQESCYPKYFIPTNEFQVIKDGQILPEGLHVRMDFSTGVKEAKIINESEETAPESTAIVIKDVAKSQVTINIKDDVASDKRSALNLNEKDSLDLLITGLNGKEPANVPKQVETLQQLTQLVHQIDIGLAVARIERVKTILLEFMQTGIPELELETVRLISAMASNNPVAQNELIEAGAVKGLWNLLKWSRNEESGLHLKTWIAFGNLVRSTSTAQKKINEIRDFQYEIQRWVAEGDVEVKKRIINFVSDLANPQMNTVSSDTTGLEFKYWCNLKITENEIEAEFQELQNILKSINACDKLEL